MAMEGPVLFQGVAKDSLAFRLMTQMGWEEGCGLGKDKQGIKSHIRVKKKNDNSGVGVDEQTKAAANWTVNTHIFDNILKNLKVQVAEPESTKENLSKVEESSDEETDVPKPKVQKIARPQGRYKKREGGKMVRGYSETDLKAILGGQGEVKAEVVPVPVVQEVVLQTVETKKSTQNGTKTTRVKKEVKEEQAAFVDIDHTSSTPMELAADWWGAKFGFVRGGALGSKIQKVRQTVNGEAPLQNGERLTTNGRTQFSEQDQENLYNLVQNKATTGKKGLGEADRPLKIGGVKIGGGKKTIFGDDDSDNEDDDEDEDESEEGGSTESQVEVSNEKVLEPVAEEKPGNKRKRDEDAAATVQEGFKIKLKDLIAQFLQEAPEQRMSLKRLHKRVIASTGLFSNLSKEGDSLKDKLLKSSRFLVEGKKVTLAPSKSRTQ